MRFLFTTLQYIESDFYGRVGDELVRRGHEIGHVAFSRRAVRDFRGHNVTGWCLPDALAKTQPVQHDIERIERDYGLPSLRDVYRSDWAVDGADEPTAVARTLRHFLAFEAIFADFRPDFVVPEVGSETMRTAAHLVARGRGTEVLFLFYTIFPRPLRLYFNHMDGPIVEPADLRALDDAEQAEVDEFIRSFVARDTPIRPYRTAPVSPHHARAFVRHLAVRALYDRDNDYLRPRQWLSEAAVERLRAATARGLYRSPDPTRPYVYFPLHVVSDYKIRRLIPHCSDQGYLVEQVASSLPQGVDLLVKEHPMAVGRTPVGLLRRLSRLHNVHIVEPKASSHELIARSRGVAVIGSTVGLEALLHFKPVLTLGQPFYSGLGVTLDVDSFAEIRDAVPALLRFRPSPEEIRRFLGAAMRRCRPGAPALVDRSDANAVALAETLNAAAVERKRSRTPV